MVETVFKTESLTNVGKTNAHNTGQGRGRILVSDRITTRLQK
jgi:hypothetical protein